MGKKRKKKPLFWILLSLAIILGCCLMVLLVVGGLRLKEKYFEKNTVSSQPIDQELVERLSDITTTNGDQVSINDGYCDDKITNEQEALESVKKVSAVLGISDVDQNLHYRSVQKTGQDTYYQYDEYLNGIPVFGRSLTVMADENGATIGLSTNYQELKGTSPKKAISKDELTKFLEEYYKTEIEYIQEPVLLYYEQGDNLRLSWFVQEKNSMEYAFVDARSGEIFDFGSLINAEAYTQDGYSVQISRENGRNYLKDSERNIILYDTVQKEALNGNMAIFLGNENMSVSSFEEGQADSTALHVLELMEKAYDYFAGMNVYRTQNGVPVTYQVRINVDNYINNNPEETTSMSGNAMWYSYGAEDEILVGRNSDQENIIWHEYTHSIVYNYTRLYGDNQSGTLNEGISDVFAELIEASVKGSCDWMNSARNATSYQMKASQITDYTECHKGITAVSHVAYYQNMHGFSYEQIANLWMRTIKLLPDNSDFDDFCFIMEAEASRMARREIDGFTEEMVQVTRDIFDELEYNCSKRSFFEYVNPDFEISIQNYYGHPSYDINLEVKGNDLTGGAKAADYFYEASFHEPETVKLHLNDGMYKIAVWDKKKARQVKGYVISREDGITSLSIQEKFTYPVKGNILEKDSSNPVDGAAIAYSISDNSDKWYAFSDSSGSYSIMLPVDNYQLEFSKEGYITTSTSVSTGDFGNIKQKSSVAASTIKNITKLSRSYGVELSDIYLEKDMPILTGKFEISSADMSPDKVSVQLSDGKTPDQWDAKTEPFYFYNLPANSNQVVEFYYNGYLCSRFPNLLLDEKGCYDMGTVLLQPVSAYVNLSSADGSDLTDTYVKVTGADGTAWNGNKTGNNSFELILPPGEYQVQAGAAGCEEVNKTITIDLEHTGVQLTLGNGNWCGTYAEIARSFGQKYTQDGVRFGLAYIDDNDIPELILSPGLYHAANCTIYTWYQGQAVNLGNLGDYGSMAFVPRSGIMYGGRWINGVGGLDVYYTLDQGKAVLQDSFGQLVDQYTGEDYYVINDNKVSQEEYEQKRAQWSAAESSLIYTDPQTGMADLNESNLAMLAAGDYSSFVVKLD